MKEYKTNLPELSIKYKSSEVKKVKLASSKDSCEFFKKLFDEDTLDYCESSIVIYLNKANITIGWFKLSQGGLDSCLIDVRMLFAIALQCGASSFIMAHNHPSGNPYPSEQDKVLTRKIKGASEFLQIKMIDHMVITTDSYFSFADEGML